MPSNKHHHTGSSPQRNEPSKNSTNEANKIGIRPKIAARESVHGSNTVGAREWAFKFRDFASRSI
jgi:hypothetical protein